MILSQYDPQQQKTMKNNKGIKFEVSRAYVPVYVIPKSTPITINSGGTCMPNPAIFGGIGVCIPPGGSYGLDITSWE
jgi:hypothetical protein